MLDIAEIFKQFGLATGLVVVLLGFILWLVRAIKIGSMSVFSWAKPQVETAIAAHIKTMEAVCQTQYTICDTQKQLVESVTSLADSVEAMDRGEKIDDIHARVVQISEKSKA